MPRKKTALKVGALHPDYQPPVRHLPAWSTSFPTHNEEEASTYARRLRELQAKRARDDFGAFLEFAFNDAETNIPMSVQWYQEEWIQAIDKHRRVLIVAPRNHGKCLARGETVHAADGRQVPIEDWNGGNLLALDQGTGKIYPAHSGSSISNGMRSCVRVETKGGRSLTVTRNHPFLVGGEWRDAGDLIHGDRVAVMCGCSADGNGKLTTSEGWFLGTLIGDGTLSKTLVLSAKDDGIAARARKFVEDHSWKFNPVPGTYDYRIGWPTRGYASRKHGPRAWLRNHGVLLCHSTHKLVPSSVWTAKSQTQWGFLAGLFDTDGGWSKTSESVDIYSTSHDLLLGVQEILGRLGVVATVTIKRGKYKGNDHLSWRCTMHGRSLRRFATGIATSACSAKSKALIAWAFKRGPGNGSGNKMLSIPWSLWRPLVRHRQSWLRERGCRIDNKYAISRSKCIRLADIDNNNRLRALAMCDLAWDTVKRVVEVGERETFNVEVPGPANFVAQGFVTHNSTFVIGRIIWELGRNPDLRIKFACEDQQVAVKRLEAVKKNIEKNTAVKEVFPNLLPGIGDTWAKKSITVLRPLIDKEPSVEANGILEGVTGGRADIIIGDDVVSERNALTIPALRERVKSSWYNDWLNVAHPTKTRVWCIFTLWHRDDLNHELMKSGEWNTLFYAVPDNYGSLWPERLPESALREQRRLIGAVPYARGFKNQAQDESNQPVQEAWLRFRELGDIPASDLVLFCSYDPAARQKETNDYFASCTIAVHPTERWIHVIDCWHARLTPAEKLRIIYREWSRYKPMKILIETSGQVDLDLQLLETYPELAGIVQAVNPRNSKYERLLSVAPLIENGMVTFDNYLDPDREGFDVARGDLIGELLDFPIGKHDDMADSLSQAISSARTYILDQREWTGQDEMELEIISI